MNYVTKIHRTKTQKKLTFSRWVLLNTPHRIETKEINELTKVYNVFFLY
jgi:hypothetical protein